MDLRIIDNNDGGDVSVFNNDFDTVTGIENMVYLALFGGSNYWGNNLFYTQSDGFNSKTEQILIQTQLNSNGRLLIESAVKEDLVFLSNFIDLEIDVIITGVNQVEIKVSTFNIKTSSSRIYQFIWDQTKRGLIYLSKRKNQRILANGTLDNFC